MPWRKIKVRPKVTWMGNSEVTMWMRSENSRLKPGRFVVPFAVVAISLMHPSFAFAQSATQQSGTSPARTLSIAGGAERAPVVQINGKTYVDLESLAQITHGALSFRANQITLALPSSTQAAVSSPAPLVISKQKLSPAFVRAGIEQMSVIREWRAAIVSAVQNNTPVTADWVSRYRLTADSRLALAAAAVMTEGDRSASRLLANEFNNMQQLSDSFVTMHTDVSYTSPNSFDNNALDQKVLGCMRAMAANASSGEYQDDVNCH